MNAKKCNCKKCAKLDYIQKGIYFTNFANRVYCEKFPKGESQLIYCKDYQRESRK